MKTQSSGHSISRCTGACHRTAPHLICPAPWAARTSGARRRPHFQQDRTCTVHASSSTPRDARGNTNSESSGVPLRKRACPSMSYSGRESDSEPGDMGGCHIPPPHDYMRSQSQGAPSDDTVPLELPLPNLSEGSLGNTGPRGHLPDGSPDSALGTATHTCESDVLDPHLSGAPYSPPANSTSLTHSLSEIPPGDVEDVWERDGIHLNDLRLTADFIKALRGASLEDPTIGLSSDALERLRNLLREQPSLSVNEDTRLAIDLFLGNSLEAKYETNRAAILRRFPDTDLPTFYRTSRLVADRTGVESIVYHMCVNSCVAYTGPFLELDCCPICSEPRYDHFRLGASTICSLTCK